MKRSILLLGITLLSFCSQYYYGQNTDSLFTVLKKAKHDSTRIQAYTELGLSFFRTNDDTAIYFYNAADKLIEKSLPPLKGTERISYLKAKGDVLINIGNSYFFLNYPDSLYHYYNKALKIYIELNDKEEILYIFGTIAHSQTNFGQHLEALETYKACEKLGHDLKDKKIIVNAICGYGSVYLRLSNVAKALESFSRSLTLYEELGDKNGITTCFVSMGYIYMQQNDIENAMNYYKKALENSQDIYSKANALNNIASLLERKNNLDEALSNYEKALKMLEGIKGNITKGALYNNIGNIYKLKGDLVKALDYNNKALAYREEMKDLLGISFSLSNIGNLYLIQKNYTVARQYCERSLKIAQEVKMPEAIRSPAERLSLIYRKTGQFEKALEMYQLGIVMRDSMNNVQNRNASVRTQLKYEFDKRSMQDSIRASEEKKIMNIKLEQEQTKKYALYGGLSLMLIFGGVMFNRFRVTQKQKTIIEQQKYMVEEKQKEIVDSIKYARRIQQSLLPTEKYIERILKK